MKNRLTRLLAALVMIVAGYGCGAADPSSGFDPQGTIIGNPIPPSGQLTLFTPEGDRRYVATIPPDGNATISSYNAEGSQEGFVKAETSADVETLTYYLNATFTQTASHLKIVLRTDGEGHLTGALSYLNDTVTDLDATFFYYDDQTTVEIPPLDPASL